MVKAVRTSDLNQGRAGLPPEKPEKNNCFLFFHKWSKWGDPFGQVYRYQDRVCLRCNHAQRRSL